MNPPISEPTLDVSGRAFVITGGTQGLGFGVAQVLQKTGAAGLALVARNFEQGREACQSLESSTCKVVFISADLGEAEEASRIIERAHQELQIPITGVVNAAATTARGNLMTETAEGFSRQFDINARAPFLITQAAAKHMMENKLPGSVVNIGSCAAHGGAPFILAYSASKAAVGCLTKTMAAELAPHQIRVNAVNMGWCYTKNENQLQSALNGNEWIEQADASVPLGRILRPQDVACTVVFLLSGASSMMTGNILELHPEFPHGMLSLATDESDGR